MSNLRRITDSWDSEVLQTSVILVALSLEIKTSWKCIAWRQGGDNTDNYMANSRQNTTYKSVSWPYRQIDLQEQNKIV